MAKGASTAKAQGSGARARIPARIFPDTTLINRVNTDELLAALPPSLNLSADQVFLFPALVSNGGLDAYYTRMSPKTLANFAVALETGIAFLDSHNTGRLPVGYSYSGQLMDYTDAQGLPQTGVLGMFYINRGIRFGAGHSYATTDDYIRAIQAAVVRDVSVGAFGGKWLCDICGNDYWGGNCPHILGMNYEIEDGLTVATLTIEDADLSEVSAVYDGATPGAAILKVQQRMRRGLLSGDEQDAVERQLGIRLGQVVADGRGLGQPSSRSNDMTMDSGDNGAQQGAQQEEPQEGAVEIVAVTAEIEAEEPQEGAAADEVVDTEIAAEVDALRVLAGQVPTAANIDVLRAIRGGFQAAQAALEQRAEEVKELKRQVAELGPLAEDGRAYRLDLIEKTLAEGTRAIGEAQFPVDVYREMLQGASLDHIKRVHDSFAQQAAALFPGGRQASAKPNTEDDAAAPATARRTRARRTPSEAYRV